MKQLCRISILVLGIVVLFSSLATGGEEDVLQALERIRAGIGDGISPAKLGELLDEAKIQIDALQKGYIHDDCFRNAARRCYYWYDLGRKSWETLIKNQEQRDKYARRAEYGEQHMKATYVKMVENYDKLIKHAQEALPLKWQYGHAQLKKAHECLKR